MRKLVSIFLALTVSCICAQEVNPAVDPAFKPTCIEAVLSSKEVHPGGQIAVTLRFRNDGSAPSRVDYTVFVHAECPEKSCDRIVVNADHMPSVPTTAWEPGRVATDGAHVLDFPATAPEGTYYLHVGVYSRVDTGLPRLSDQYVAEIEVSRTAPQTEAVPQKMTGSETSKRRGALAARISDAVTLENDQLAFRISQDTGTWELTDKATGEVWHSNPEDEGLAEVRFTDGERTITRRVDTSSDVQRHPGRIVLTYTPELPDCALTVQFTIELLSGSKGVRFSYAEIRNPPPPRLRRTSPRSAIRNEKWHIESTRFLDRALWTTDTDRGYLAIPHRMGILFPASEGLPCISRYSAYSNYRSYSMAMFGAVKNGSALLVHWDDPYTILEVRRSWPDLPLVPGHGMVSASLILSKSAKSFVIKPLGKGEYVEVARAYREVARERGLLRTWGDKIKANPNVESVLGAADFKPFVCARLLPGTKYNRGTEEVVNVGYTFDEAAQIAEHLRNDLGIDRAMLVLAGWIHRGYDNQHPDILPAAAECGGNDGLADCASRVKSLGYLFGLHDNYQDMYKDAPSWDESFIMKRADGSLRRGGEWLGGQAYLTCSRKALELARREQNLPAVKKLFAPTVYFIDTTFAAPPFECFDPEHPLTLDDDMHWKRKLCEYARETFGLFGSEEGQEWAVPCADYFEGLMSHRTQRGGKEIIVPLFEMVYGDCINVYTHQGDRATADRPNYILDHILCAEMPVYHFGTHLYFRDRGDSLVRAEPSVHDFRQVGPRVFEITYAWRVESPAAADFHCFVHFVKPGSSAPEGIAFQNDHPFARKVTSWQPGETILDGLHTVEIPADVSGPFDLLIGLWDGERRVPLLGRAYGYERYHIGRVEFSEGRILLEQPSAGIADAFCFARRDADAPGLNQTDRFIKNTYEILSPLNRVAAHTPMTAHEFLTADQTVEHTRFGDVEITVNYGAAPYRTSNAVLPQYGFLIESPRFVAFHATEYGGTKLSKATMAAARSLDGKPLAESENVSLYRAFGDSRVKIAGREFRP